jgi:hypothetical protein
VQSGDKRYLLEEPSTGDACRLWAYPLHGMLLSARLLLLLIVLVAFAAQADVVDPTDQELRLVRDAAEWIKQADPERLAKNWPYHLGSLPVCRSTFLSLEEPPPAPDVEGEVVKIEPPRFEGAWILADLDRDLFWLLLTKRYFAASHYYGPTRMNEDRDLVVSPPLDGKPDCPM